MLRGFLRAGGREFVAVLARLALYVGLLAGVIAGIAKLLPVPQSAALGVPHTDWVAAERLPQAFSIGFPDLPDPSPGYVILRDPAGNGRKDIVTLAGGGRIASVEIYRPGTERSFFGPPRREIAMRAAALGQIENVTPAPPMDSKFGPVQLVDFSLKQGDKRRGCLGFMHVAEEPPLQIVGWLCHRAEGLVARPRLACGLDRLALLASGNDAKLAQLFARAELEAGFCGRKGGTRAPAADWITAPRGSKLRAGREAPDGLSTGAEGGYSGREFRLRMRAL